MESKAIDLRIEPLEKLLKALKKGGTIKVGILGDKDARKHGGGSNATIGLKHEFGLDGMPERSFLRMPIGSHLQRFLDKKGLFDKDALDKVFKKSSITPWLKKIGLAAEECIQDAFETGGFGQWAPWKGSYKSKTGQILVDTTDLRDSISSQVEGDNE